MKHFASIIILLFAANLFFGKPVEKNFESELFPLDSIVTLHPEPHHSEINNLLSTIISRYHYKKIKVDDSLSSQIFDGYLKTLDFGKYYLLASDVNEFEKWRYEFDNQLLEGDLNPSFRMFNRFRERVEERLDYVNNVILKKEFSYDTDETFQPNREDAPWAKSENELNDLWRKRIKHDALNLSLTGKEWESISETLTKRYENFRKSLLQYKSEDVFQLVMNSYTESIDPHSNYLSPATSENFNISMSRSLEGIGAQLQTEDDYTKVMEVIPGGPAFKSGLLHRDDRIVAVAQGDDGEMVDVIGWRITDVVQLIRGPKESVVRLQVLKATEGANAIPKTIRLVRDRVKLEEQLAKKEVIEINQDGQNYRIGVIEIPAFYIDFEAQRRREKDYRSTTRDVRNLLKELESENVDGVIVDLRNNGGGSLQEAIQLTGLFIEAGPIVQVRNADGTIEVGEDPDPSISYSGPLAVMINRYSASASEIFAGAIQDYGRGVIVGEQTYGKGTVQNLIDLNKLKPNSDVKLGQVKLTIAKYYRINGGSTQHLGVIPDIQFPSAYDPKEFGESSQPSALPWDKIESSSYKNYADISSIIPELIKRHNQRVKKNPEFDYILEDIEEYKASKGKKTVSLNEKVRKQEKQEEDDKRFNRENERRKFMGLKLLDKNEVANDSLKQTDPLLTETGNILSDFIKVAD